METLYQRVLGAKKFADLHPPLRRFHASPRAEGTGTFRVTHGPGRLARLLAAAMRLPPASDAVAVRLSVSPLGRGELWVRSFDGSPFVTAQTAGRGLLHERAGPLWIGFALDVVAGGGMTFTTREAALMGLPLPLWLAPKVTAVVVPYDDRGWTVTVRMTAPLIGQVLEYHGVVIPSCT